MWCRLRSFSDRQTFLLVRAILSAYACRWETLTESAIWRNASERGNSSKRGGWEASWSFTFRTPAWPEHNPLHWDQRSERLETSEIRTENRRRASRSHRAIRDTRQEVSDQRGIQGFHSEATWPESWRPHADHNHRMMFGFIDHTHNTATLPF